MTPQEMEALTPDELGAELGWTGSASNSKHADAFLRQCQKAIAHAARLYPVDAAEAPENLAHDIASGTDWGGDAWWDMAFRLAKALLSAYTPEEV